MKKQPAIGTEKWLDEVKREAEFTMHLWHDLNSKEQRQREWGDDYNAVEELREKRRKRNQP